MTHRTRVIWDDALLAYDFGPQHPMNPTRLDLTVRLAKELGVFRQRGVRMVKPQLPSGGDDFLLAAHTPKYLDAVIAASKNPKLAQGGHGLGTEDVPAFRGMHETARLQVAGSLQMVREVWNGKINHGVNFTGGLHHAMPDAASGFCVYNDAAVAIRWLLDAGVERVAYVDIDAHHGDGVEKVFWDDPRVLTCSIHETGQVLFPGTGFARDLGGPDAEGHAVNMAMPAASGDAAWLRALYATIIPVVRAFSPQILITQHGCDSHHADPLTHMVLTLDGQKMAHEAMHDLAHEVCDGKWVALGGGGYELYDVVPLSWTHLTAIAAHHPIPLETEIPGSWREHVLEKHGVNAPKKMGDGIAENDYVWFQSWASGMNPNSAVDRAIMATRERIFPHHGLDVWYD